MSESSRKALVVSLELKPHENSDNLSLVAVEGYTVVVKTDDWKDKTSGIFLEPETRVDVRRPEFSFLKRPDKNRDHEIITVRKFRGIWSQGLLVPNLNNHPIGYNCWEELGLEHWEPSEEPAGLIGGEHTSAPSHWGSLPRFDLENFRKYFYLFKEGEPVSILEKNNGANMSCVYSDGAYHVRSRDRWKTENEWSDFWKGLKNNEPVLKYLRDHENHLLQGELIGKVKGFLYGLKNGEVAFRAFDMRTPDYMYMDSDRFIETCLENNIRTPQVFEHNTPFSTDLPYKYVDGFQEGTTDKIREGIVLKPLRNRYEDRLNGRLALKLVSNVYLEKVNR